MTWEDPSLNAAFTKCTRNDWTYNELGPFSIDSVSSEHLFKVEVNLGMNFGNDHLAITDLTIICDPLSAFTAGANLKVGESQQSSSNKNNVVQLVVDGETTWNVTAMVMVLAMNVVCIWYYVESKNQKEKEKKKKNGGRESTSWWRWCVWPRRGSELLPDQDL